MMKITHIGSVLLEPMGWVLVKVQTDEGITGIGEAYHGAGVHQIVTDEGLTRPLIGQDLRKVDKTCHVMAAVPNFLVLEFHHLDHPIWDALITETPLIQDGYINVPNRPGLGVTLNEDTVRENTKENLGFFAD